MASKKSSAVPNNPTIAALAPSDSRYFGRNFFHSSSPSPTKNTAPEAAATFRPIPSEAAVSFGIFAPVFAAPASFGSFKAASTKRSVWLSPPHHLLTVRIECVIHNPLRGVDIMIILESQVTKSLGDRVQPSSLRLLPQRVVRIRPIHDLPQEHQRRISRQFVFLQDCFERTFFPVMSKFHFRHIKRRRLQSPRLAHHLLRGHKVKLRLSVHKFLDQPGACHPVHLYAFPCNPFHDLSLQFSERITHPLARCERSRALLNLQLVQEKTISARARNGN